jgi:hypothetical protein
MDGDGNENVGRGEMVLDKKELAKQRKVFLARERRHAEKLIRERQCGLIKTNGLTAECDVVDNQTNRDGNENVGTLETVSDKKELARQRKVLLQRERRAEKLIRDRRNSIIEINDSTAECDVDRNLVRKRKRNEVRNERYESSERHKTYIANKDKNKQREKIDSDAQRFRSYVDDHLVFGVCCICAF